MYEPESLELKRSRKNNPETANVFPHNLKYQNHFEVDLIFFYIQ